MDCEQKAKLKNKGRGLGLRGPCEGIEDWYGGCIQKVTQLQKMPGTVGYSILLGIMQHGKPNHVTLFFTSWSILQFQIEEKLVWS